MENNFTEKNQRRGGIAVQKYVQLKLSIKPDSIVRYPTIDEDMQEHWDVEIDGVKADVKDNMTYDKEGRECFPIEIQNNWGTHGSLFGKADIMVYQFYDTFIEINRKMLIKYNEEHTIRKLVPDIRDAVGYYYRRVHEGKKDLITLIPFENITNNCKQIYHD